MKNIKITLKLLNSFKPCYNPEELGFTNKLELTPIEFIRQAKNKVKNKEDIIWVLCRREFMSDRDLRLFAVWCAREALKLVKNPDLRSINVCNVAEKFANDKATKEELATASAAADAAARDASWASWAASSASAASAARDAQIEQLKTYFLKL